MGIMGEPKNFKYGRDCIQKKAPSSKASGKCSKAILHSGNYLKLMNLAFHLFEVKNKFKRLKMGDSVMFDQI